MGAESMAHLRGKRGAISPQTRPQQDFPTSQGAAAYLFGTVSAPSGSASWPGDMLAFLLLLGVPWKLAAPWGSVGVKCSHP